MVGFFCRLPAYFRTSLFVRPSITSQDWMFTVTIRPSEENEQSATAGVDIMAFETISTGSRKTLRKVFPMLMSRDPFRRMLVPELERGAGNFLQSNVARSQSAGLLVLR